MSSFRIKTIKILKFYEVNHKYLLLGCRNAHNLILAMPSLDDTVNSQSHVSSKEHFKYFVIFFYISENINDLLNQDEIEFGFFNCGSTDKFFRVRLILNLYF